MMAKAQLALFIILGVVFVAIIVIIYFKISSPIPVGKRLEVLESIKQFVESCLQMVGEDGLLLLGSQGGLIFEDQGGIHSGVEGKEFLKINGMRVGYAIDFPTSPVMRLSKAGPTNDPDLFFEELVNGKKVERKVYPWYTFPVHPGRDELLFSFQLIGGESRLPPLYKNLSNSIQESLESYVEKKIQSCSFKGYEEQGIEVRRGAPKASVTFSDKKTSFFLYWPLEIEFGGARLKLENHVVSVPVGLSLVYKQLSALDTPSLIVQDVSNLSFDVSKHAIVKDLKEKGTLVTYTTPAFRIRGSPYQFTFARKNRPPALFAIKNLLKSCKEPELKNGELILENERIEIKALEPDEQEISLSLKSMGENVYRIIAHDTAGEIDFQDFALEECP